MSLDVKGEACGNDFHESMQVNVSQCKSMYDGQDNVRWLDGSMARWLDGGINGSIDVARWLDANGGCLQPRCLDARLNANLDAKLDAGSMRGSMQARCRLDASRPGLSDERTASEVTYSEAETVPLMFPSNGPSAGLKGGCLAAVLSDFKWSVCRMDASAHELVCVYPALYYN